MTPFIGGSLTDFQAVVWADACGLRANTCNFRSEFLEIADPARSALGRLLRLQCNMIMLASALWCSVRLRSIFCD